MYLYEANSKLGRAHPNPRPVERDKRRLLVTRNRFLTLIGLTAALLALLLIGVYTAQARQTQFDSYTLPGDQAFPEGIAFQQSTGDFYVSSTTDGAIYKGNIARQAAEVWLPGATEGLTGTRGMKVDGQGRLFASAGPQGMMYVFDTADKRLLSKLSTNVPGSFINDVSIAPDGAAYFTDSRAPNIYKVAAGSDGAFSLETWLVVSPTIVYTTGFNLGGIDISDDGSRMIVAQANTGLLYRIDMASKGITEISVSEPMTGADGIWLDGQTLYVVRNSLKLLVTSALSADMGSGTVVSSQTHPTFNFPTTLAKAGDRLLIVNGQFDRRDNPALPFVVTSMPAPQAVAQPAASPTSAPAAATPTSAPVEVPTAVVSPVVPGMPTTGAGDMAGLAALLAVAAMLIFGGGLALRVRRGN